MEHQPRVKKKDRTGVWVSILVHVGAFAVVLIILFTTKLGEDIRMRIIGAVRPADKPPPPPPPSGKATQKAAEAPPPAASSAGRRKVDAPSSAGGGFAIEERKEQKGAATESRETKAPPPRPPPPPPKALPTFTFTPPKSDIKQLLAERQSSAVVGESFGSEQISKTGASDAGDIVGRIAGASVADGKFAVVRGLSDRYTAATLNGAEIPSADPYRKSVQLDLFPASVVEAVKVSKTFTPDQPGSFTGGNINIVTKSFPAEPFVKASVGVEYNTQATGNDDFLVAPEGSIGALGFGRDIAGVPSSLRDPDTLQPGGFGNPASTPQRNAPRNETVAGAQNRRAQANQLQAYNHDLGVTGFAPKQESPPLNHNFSVEAGTTFVGLFERRFGVFGSFNYDRDYAHHEDATQDRYQGNLTPKRFMTETRSRIDTQFGGSATVALELSPDHILRFNMLFNQSIEDEARVRTGKDFQGGSSDPLLLNQLHYTDRQLQTYQLIGQHQLTDQLDNKLDWIASYALTSQDEPNFRFFHATVNPDGSYTVGSAGLPEPRDPSRFFRELEEKNLTLKLDDTQGFHWFDGQRGEFKTGLFYSTSERTVSERTFSYKSDGGSIITGDINDYLASQNLNYTATRAGTFNPSGIRTNYNFSRYVTSDFGNNDSEGTLEVRAGYFMVDSPFTSWLRFIGGVRYETTLYDVTGKSRDATGTETANIDEADILPALGLVFGLSTNVNLRLHWAQTIARPSFREIAPGNTYDIVTDTLFVGNPDLQISHIDNYDLRLEWFRRPGEVVSFSAFYKTIDMPIELEYLDLANDKAGYKNREAPATIWGLEFEARSRLDVLHRSLDNFTLGANMAYIQSSVELTPVELQNKQRLDPDVDDTRPLYDQSPYIFNFDLSYDNPYSGTVVTLVANLTAERIFVSNALGPDVYEHPAPTLDLIISQRLGRRWRLKFSAKNLLDPEFKRTYGPESDDLLYSKAKKGRSFSVSLSGDF